jgi:arylsulfatase A-like enzyme
VAGCEARVDDTPVCGIDFLPTIAEAAGAAPSAYKDIDGVSLVSLIRDRKPLRPRPLYWHYPHYSNQGGTPGTAVREGDYKLIYFFEDERVELYNLREDIGETRDLAQARADIADELSRKLWAWQEALGVQMPKVNPNRRWWGI